MILTFLSIGKAKHSNKLNQQKTDYFFLLGLTL